MKRFLLKILLFAAIFAVADLALGFVFDRMRDDAGAGTESGRNRMIACEATAPVVTFGSSRCYHHYSSDIMSEVLGKEVINAGEDGNGVVLAYGRYLLMAERYSPEIVLLDIEPGFDIVATDDIRSLKPLRPFYGASAGLPGMFGNLSWSEPLKMLSHTYRYNSQILTLAKDNALKEGNYGDYDLLYAGNDPNFEEMLRRDKPLEVEYDPVKKHYLELFITETRKRGSVPVLAFSPHYGKSNSDELAHVKEVAKKYNVPVLDHYADTLFMNHREYFVDPYHLNAQGAELYSRIIARELLPYLPSK